MAELCIMPCQLESTGRVQLEGPVWGEHDGTTTVVGLMLAAL